MSRHVECDRCGEELPRSKRHIVWASKEAGGDRDRVENIGDRKSFDLCQECRKELDKFMNEVEKE